MNLNIVQIVTLCVALLSAVAATIAIVAFIASGGAKDQTLADLKARDIERHKAELVEMEAKTRSASAIEEIRSDMRDVKALGDRVNTLTGTVDRIGSELIFHRETHHDQLAPMMQRHELTLAEHEKRIQSLEIRAQADKEA